MSSEIEELKNKLVLKPLNGPEELRDWMYTFLDIKFPMGVVYPGSTHGPVDAMWRIYELMKTGESRDVPQVCMLASRDSYKCQVKGSKVLTKDGLINIEKIQIGDVVWSGKNWRKVTNWIDDGEKKGIKVTLKNNIELTSTPIHRYWIIRNGKEQWCKAEDLEETDRICYNLNTPLSNGFEIEQEKFDNGYFLGLLMGDGGVSSIESPTHSHISFTTIDKTIKNWYYNYCINKFGKAPTQSKHDPITHCIWDKNAISEIIEMGVKPSRAWEKTIPNYCYTSNSAMMGFVSGLFDSDGTFDGKNAIDFPITAGKLLKELQIVFASWGINAKYRANSKKYSNQNHLVHHLIINGHEIPKLYKLGFVNKAKKAGYYKEPEIYDAHDTINFENIQFFIDYCNKNKPQIRGRKYLKPKIGYQRCKDSKVYEGITYGKINDLFLWFQENMEHNKAGNDAENIYKRVSNILNNRWYSFKKENVDSAHFYDLTVEKDHSYWCNGCISHNTLSAAAIEVLCMLHFEISVAHGAAIKSQSEKAIQYVNSFFRKLSPYLEANGWSKLSDSKAKIEWLTSKGDAIYLRIVVATVAGMNSEHVPMLFMDEIDVVQDPRALEEAKMIPCVYKGYFPLTVYLSTRKYAGGLMEKTLKDTERSGGEILRWNIIDVTERIPHSEAKINEEKVMRYISRELPLRNLSPDEFEELNEESRHKYEAINVYPGIADHPMLSVMKNSLADRPQDNVGDLYKPIYAVHNNFKQTSPEMGEAQLLCNKPSSSGLVYPRFDSSENAISIDEAYTYLSGEEEKNKTLDDLIQYMHNLGIEFYGAADWGNTDETALGIFAKITGGKSWLIDLVSAPDMEIPEIVIKVKELTEIYKVKKWFCDSNYPAYIKMLRKTNTENGKIPAVGVKKGAESVVDGITCVQSKIVDANNNRDFKVLKTRNTERVFDAFETYKWKIDGKGNPIDGKPEHGKDGTADIMDMVRYFFYSMFGRGSKVLFSYDLENTKKRPANLQHKINELSGNRDSKIKKTGKNKGIILDI